MGKFQFSKGMEVEVSSDDKGLRGVLFVGTVLRSTSRRNKVLVEYHTLMADETGSKPLRESVDVINLRPTPPREIRSSFNLSDEVDAFHNDGWWEGVVVKLLDDSRYLVYFRSGKEERECGLSDLRIHREWVGGKWVPPVAAEKQERGKGVHLQQQEEESIDMQCNQVDIRRSDQAPVSSVHNTADITNESNTIKNRIQQQTPDTPPWKKFKKGEATESSSFLGEHCEKAMSTTPTTKGDESHLQKKKVTSQIVTDIFSLPSEGLTDGLATNFVQKKTESVLDCDFSVVHPIVDDLTLLPLLNKERERCDSLETDLHCLQKNLGAQPLPHSITKTECNQVDVKSDQAHSMLVDNTTDIANKLNTIMQQIERPPRGTPLCKEFEKGGATEGSLILKKQCEEAKPTNPTTKEEEAHLQKKKEISEIVTDILLSPSEGLTHHLATKSQKNFGIVIDCDFSGNHPTIDDSNSSLLFNKEGEQCNSSEIDLHCSQKSFVVQSPPPSTRKREVDQIDVRRSGQTLVSPIDNTTYIANQSNAVKQKIEIPTPETPPGKKFKKGEGTEDFSLLGEHCEKAIPTMPTIKEGEAPFEKKNEISQNVIDTSSIPSEGLIDIASNGVNEESESILGRDFRLSPPINGGEQCDSSKTYLPCLQDNLCVRSLPDSIKISDQQQCGHAETGQGCSEMLSNGKQHSMKHELEQDLCNTKKSKRRVEQRCLLVEPFIPSDDQQQCRRTGKGWRCPVMAFPGKRYCEKHEWEQNIRNEKRRKRPVEQSLVVMEPFLPSDQQRCRRTGKGWRCSATTFPGKRYCEKHQLEQNIHNEKRRERRRERSCLTFSGGDERSNANDEHFIALDHLQRGGVSQYVVPRDDEGDEADMSHLDTSLLDTKFNQSDARESDQAHMSQVCNTDVTTELKQGDPEKIDQARLSEVVNAAVSAEPNQGDDGEGDLPCKLQKGNILVDTELNPGHCGQIDQGCVSQVGKTPVSIDIADESAAKKKMGAFFDEFWSVFIT